MKLPDSFLIVLVLDRAAVERYDLVPVHQSRYLRRAAGIHPGHDIGAQGRLVLKIEAEFNRRGLFEMGSGHPGIGIE